MIKKIILETIAPLGQEERLDINFSPGINLIIGEKGSGKSLLLELLALAEEGKKAKSITKAFQNYHLSIVSVFKGNGEEIPYKNLNETGFTKIQLEKYFSKEKINLICQNDQVKTDLSKYIKFEKEKIAFVEEVIYDSKSVSKFIKKIEMFHQNFEEIRTLFNSKINWNNIFSMDAFKHKKIDAIFLRFTYDPFDYLLEINKNLEYLAYIIQLNKEYSNKLKQFLDSDFVNSNIRNFIMNQLETISKFNETLVKDYINIERKKSIIKIFKSSFDHILEKIKNEGFEEVVKKFVIEAKEHVKKLSLKIKKLNHIFSKLIREKNTFSFDNRLEKNFFEFRFPEVIEITDEQVFDMLKIFYNSPKTKTTIFSWIDKNIIISSNLSSVSKEHTFSEAKIRDKIISFFAKELKVYANNQEYENMSLGERSIIGIRYKFKRNKSPYFFLDQPEDNLDNYTIATEIVNLIANSSDDKQVFLITHNANIGILTKPKNIIIASLGKVFPPYHKGQIITKKKGDEDGIRFLEGGKDSLEKRYKIVIKGDMKWN